MGPERCYSWNVLGYISLAVRPKGVQPDMLVPNVSDRDVRHDTISDTFRAQTLHHPGALKVE